MGLHQPASRPDGTLRRSRGPAAPLTTPPVPHTKGLDMDVLTGRIVVGYDGSAQSCAAVDWAAAEAHHRGLPLTVLHVIDPYSMLANVMGPSGWPAALTDD